MGEAVRRHRGRWRLLACACVCAGCAVPEMRDPSAELTLARIFRVPFIIDRAPDLTGLAGTNQGETQSGTSPARTDIVSRQTHGPPAHECVTRNAGNKRTTVTVP